ncbi:helix-loop-helix DNA-binding domain-containing protein [Ditylenchus destructor]|nr:helix-loop-helix DNA-binding domain-containing protein [Ditylenchus destructor]
MVKSDYTDEEPVCVSGEEEDGFMHVEWSSTLRNNSSGEYQESGDLPDEGDKTDQCNMEVSAHGGSNDSVTSSMSSSTSITGGSIHGGSGGDPTMLSPISTTGSTGAPNNASNCFNLDDKRLRRQIANCNERRRMQSINAGFQSLRNLLPLRKDREKMSKAAILQQTAEYVHMLLSDRDRLMQENELKCKRPRLDICEERMNNEELGNSKESSDIHRTCLRTIEELRTALANEQQANQHLRLIYEKEILEMRNANEAQSVIPVSPLASIAAPLLLSPQKPAADFVIRPVDNTNSRESLSKAYANLLLTSNPLRESNNTMSVCSALSSAIASLQQQHQSNNFHPSSLFINTAVNTVPHLSAFTSLGSPQGESRNDGRAFPATTNESHSILNHTSSVAGLAASSFLQKHQYQSHANSHLTSPVSHIKLELPSHTMVSPNSTANGTEVTSPTGDADSAASTSLSQRNLQSILEAIRHIEGQGGNARGIHNHSGVTSQQQQDEQLMVR